MINWELSPPSSVGESTGTNWSDAIFSDIAELIGKALRESNGGNRRFGSVLYLELWPDSGRLICYRADPPKDGMLAERTTEETFELTLPFWQTEWLSVSLNAPEAIYRRIKRRALDAVSQGLKECALRDSDLGQVALYAFEFEGSDGFTVFTV